MDARLLTPMRNRHTLGNARALSRGSRRKNTRHTGSDVVAFGHSKSCDGRTSQRSWDSFSAAEKVSSANWSLAEVADAKTLWMGLQPGRILLVQVYALASSHVPEETLDLFLTQEAAEAELREILEDEPEWVDVLRVVPIELDGRELSAN